MSMYEIEVYSGYYRVDTDYGAVYEKIGDAYEFKCGIDETINSLEDAERFIEEMIDPKPTREEIEEETKNEEEFDWWCDEQRAEIEEGEKEHNAFINSL